MDKTPIDSLIKFIQEDNPTNEQIIVKLNDLRSVEEHMVNRSYMTGFYDKESNKNHKNNYYKNKYGPNWFTNMLKK
jgi:hypothetical protein